MTDPSVRIRRRGCCVCPEARKGTPHGTLPTSDLPLPCSRTPGTCPHGLDAALAIDDKQTPIFDEVSEEDGSWRTEDSGAWHESDEDFADRQNTAASLAPYLAVLPHLAGVLSDKQREVINALLDARKQADLARSIDVRRQTTGVHLKRAKGRLSGILLTLHREAASSAIGKTTLDDGLVSLARVANTMTAHQALVMLELVAGWHASWGLLGRACGIKQEAALLLVRKVTKRLDMAGVMEESGVVDALRHPVAVLDLSIATRRTLATQLAGIYVARARLEDTRTGVRPTWDSRITVDGVLSDLSLAADNSVKALDAASGSERSDT